MKKIRFYLVAVVAIVLFSSMAWVRISLLHPALIVLPESIRNVAIVDRTLQEESVKNKMEQVLSGELMKQDEQAVRQSMIGMINVCAEFNLYNLMQTHKRYIGGGTKTTFPALMNWDTIAAICKENGADAVLAIEIFDSDFLITNPGNVARQVLEGNALGGSGYHVNGVAVINFGVRLYDPSTRKVIDEYQVSHRMNLDAGGNTVQDAVNQVLDKIGAINQAGYQAGRLYGERISPSYYTVIREFYNKPKRNHDLRAGVRKSEVADWNGAIESWTKALDDKRRVARRAAFNIAVAYEVLGDLDKAKEWAAKSYTEYGEKRGNDYFNMLVYRIREEAEIRRQVPDQE